MPKISLDVKQNQANRLGGFTLVELLVVISIIGILVAMVMPAINSAREAGRRITCENNLHQLALGCKSYEAQWQTFPSGGQIRAHGDPDFGPGANQPGGWHYNILPFIDQNDLHDIRNSSDRAQVVVSVFLCPTRHRVQAFSFNGSIIGRSDYAGNAGSNFSASDPKIDNYYGVIYPASNVSAAKIKDGLSYTYLIGERFMTINAYNQSDTENDAGWDSGGDCNTIRWTGNTKWETPPRLPTTTPYPPSQDRDIPVTTPVDITTVAALFGSAHPAGFHMAFCDGSVRKMNYNVTVNAYGNVHAQLGARADNQPTQLQDIE